VILAVGPILKKDPFNALENPAFDGICRLSLTFPVSGILRKSCFMQQSKFCDTFNSISE